MGERKPRIVVLGGGFGGLYTVQDLVSAGAHHWADITLVDEKDHFLFTPLLYEVLTREVEDWHIAPRLTAIFPPGWVNVVQGRVIAVDPAARRLTLASDGEGIAVKRTLEYDSLVVALGNRNATFGIPGVGRWTIPFRSLADAHRLKARIGDILSDAETSPTRAAGLLDFAVIGAGPSGVEIAGKLADLMARELSRRRIGPPAARIHLIELAGDILPGTGSSLVDLARAALADHGISLHLKQRVVSCDGQGVTLEGGTVIPARTLIWTAGTEIPDIVKSFSGEKDRRGRLVVGKTLEVAGLPGVFALGDNAAFPNGLPATAQVAIRQARTAAANVRAFLGGRPLEDFEFQPVGEMLTLGIDTAAANVLGVRLNGLAGSLFRRAFYLSTFPSWEHQVRVGVSWTGRTIETLLSPFCSFLPEK